MVQEVERLRKLDTQHLLRYNYTKNLVYGKTVDVGCGWGPGTHILSTGEKVTETVGVDVVSRMLEDVRITYPHIRFECINLQKFHEKFDSVVCIGVIEHVEDFEKTKQSLKAMLSPGGIFIYYVPYLEPKGVNIHHCLSMLDEDSFLDVFPNSEFLYQDRNGFCKKDGSFGIFGIYHHPA